MKKIALVFAVLLVFAVTPVIAKEFERNPDHYPSMSFGLGAGDGDGRLDFLSFGETTGYVSFDVDTWKVFTTFVVPTSERTSLFGGVAYSHRDVLTGAQGFKREGSDADSETFSFTLGFTLYFNGR